MATSHPWNHPDLRGKIALVAGATRGAGRAIARALGVCGATVYCTGRSTSGNPGMAGRPETIDETAALIEAAGGRGVAVRVDHSDAAQVRALVERIAREQGRLDILVNDVWGGDPLVEWGKPFWEHSLENGITLLERAIHTHIITAHLAGRLIVASKGIIVEITDGNHEHNRAYRGNIYYDLAKVSVNRLALAMASELGPLGATAIAVTPGFLRSEAMLEHFGVKEENWRDGAEKDPYFAESETPAYVARAVAHLVADPKTWARGGECFTSAQAARMFGFTDADGRTPDFDAVLARLAAESA